MFNFIKHWRERKRKKAQMREMQTLCYSLGLIKKLQRGGLLHWSEKDRHLYIAQPLATVILAWGADRWANFLNNVYLYEVQQLLDKRWRLALMGEQSKAVREQREKRPNLTRAEIERIRRAVADNLDESKVELPPIKPFEFYILADDIEDKEKNKVAYVGEYNPDTETFEMATWEDVKSAVELMNKQ